MGYFLYKIVDFGIFVSLMGCLNCKLIRTRKVEIESGIKIRIIDFKVSRPWPGIRTQRHPDVVIDPGLQLEFRGVGSRLVLKFYCIFCGLVIKS